MAKLQSKIVIAVRNPDDYDEENEKALLKLNNYRETFLDEDGKVLSARTGGSVAGGEPGESIDPDDEFNPDKIPSKILITTVKLPEVPNVVALYHPEAAYSLRKTLIDQGRKTFKELEKVDF